MTDEPLNRFEQLFQTAQMRPPDERAAFLETACASDPALRRELESLLRADEEAEAEGFLAEPVVRRNRPPSPRITNQQIRFCTAPDGVRIAFATVGEGPPLVKAANYLTHLEHDWHSPVWRHWLRGLAEHHTLIRYDERGCGLSDWDVTTLSIDAWVQDLEAVVEALELDRFPLLGISQGASVSVAYAVKHPEKVSHLILYGGYARGRFNRDLTPEQRTEAETLINAIRVGWGQENPAFRQLFSTQMMPEGTEEQMRWLNDLARVSATPENAAAMERAFYHIDVTDLAPEVTVPTLVLHSRADAAIPFEEGQRLAALIPGARFVALESKNHILLETEPAWPRFLHEVRTFLGVETSGLFALPDRADTPDFNWLPLVVDPATDRSDLSGQTVAQYDILEKLGSGGMGVVYKARDRRLDRPVALKFMPSALSAYNTAKQRFVQEAKAASALDHPNICTIYDIAETQGGALYLAMACYDGETLKEKIARGPLPVEEALDYAVQTAEGLQRAHEAGIVHRDVKPANVMVTERGLVKLLDFGVAKVADVTLTKTGAALGTTAYMSPEQVRGESVDERTDLWALGVVLYEMLTGQRPFRGDHDHSVMYAIVHTSPERVTALRPDLPPSLDALLIRALHKDPERRFSSAQEMAQAVRRVQARKATPSAEPEDTAAPSVASDFEVEEHPIVGRDDEMALLHQRLGRVLRGERQVVFVTGEAGLGKTTLVETFLRQARGTNPLLIGRGQCLEDRGEGEPYLPVLEALGRLCKGPHREALVTLLTKHAPTWLVQMPWLLDAAELERLQRRVVGTTRERMLREFVEALERVTQIAPLILVLEDLHWSDNSTVQLIDGLARRREPARLLVLGTYRPAELRTGDHPLAAIKQELSLRSQCAELALELLSETEATVFLQRQLDGEPPAGLSAVIHQRTDGNPLFMHNVIDFWTAQGALVNEAGTWTIRAGLDQLAVGVPDTLRQMIEQQFRQLSSGDQQMLEAASVVGMEFSAAAASAGLDTAADEVEIRCARLARAGAFLASNGLAEWPDGTVSTQFHFMHSLYQDVLYDRVPAGHRARLHRKIGDRLEVGYGDQVREHAAELALHFTRGHDLVRAVAYLQEAAERALRRSAPQEAIKHLTTGVGLLRMLPETPEHIRREINLQTMLGQAYIATKGWAAPEAEQAYHRAHLLGQRLNTSADLVPVLFGMATMYELRGEYQKSQTLIEQRLELPHDPDEEEAVIESHELFACSTFHQGGVRPGARTRRTWAHPVQSRTAVFAAGDLWRRPRRVVSRLGRPLALVPGLSRSGTGARPGGCPPGANPFLQSGHRSNARGMASPVSAGDRTYAAMG